MPGALPVRDRDARFCRGFDEVFRSQGAEVLVTPAQAPHANAYAERWVRTVRTQRLDWLLIVGCSHLEQVLRIYVRHDNEHRPYRALGLNPPNPHAAPARVGGPRRAECAAATCLMDWFTSTNELHERLYAPYDLGAASATG